MCSLSSSWTVDSRYGIPTMRSTEKLCSSTHLWPDNVQELIVGGVRFWLILYRVYLVVSPELRRWCERLRWLVFLRPLVVRWRLSNARESGTTLASHVGAAAEAYESFRGLIVAIRQRRDTPNRRDDIPRNNARCSSLTPWKSRNR